MEFTIVNKLVDCDEEYSHITRVTQQCSHLLVSQLSSYSG